MKLKLRLFATQDSGRAYQASKYRVFSTYLLIFNADLNKTESENQKLTTMFFVVVSWGQQKLSFYYTLFTNWLQELLV